jgi:hypothetical protein
MSKFKTILLYITITLIIGVPVYKVMADIGGSGISGGSSGTTYDGTGVNITATSANITTLTAANAVFTSANITTIKTAVAADNTLSGTPIIITVYDVATNTPYYFKAYPTKP